MDQLSQAVLYMAEHARMTDLFCWHSQARDGVWAWHASCKIDERSCFVGEGPDAVSAMLNALEQAWSAAKAKE
jgi:hypothetical protein